MLIEIVNWEKYNPRSDVKRPHWYRMDADFLIDDAFNQASLGARLMWVIVLGERCKARKPVFKLNVRVVATYLGLTESQVLDEISWLAAAKLLRIHDPAGICTDPVRDPADSRTESVRDPYATGQDRTGQDRTPEVDDDSPPVGRAPSDFDRSLAQEWADHARQISSSLRPRIAQWADALRLLRERDGLSEEECRAVFDFVRGDPFWRVNAVSPAALRGRSKNGLRKIENVMLQMQQVRAKPAEHIRSLDDLYPTITAEDAG